MTQKSPMRVGDFFIKIKKNLKKDTKSAKVQRTSVDILCISDEH